MKKRALYLGDSPKNGPACYLLGILKHARFSITHIEPSKTLSRSLMRNPFSLIIISDYSRKKLNVSHMAWMEERVKKGAGFVMIGGWCSFNGFNQGYKGSLIEKILPVTCLHRDDRQNLASGAFFDRARISHPAFRAISLLPSPVLVGYNKVLAKKKNQILLRVRGSTNGKQNPLLVVGHYGKGKTAAWTSDLAPHWCGGLLDWGKRRLKIKIAKNIQIEVGNTYIHFFTTLFKWLTS